MISGINRLRKQTVVVHIQDGPSLRGVLTKTYRDCMVLSHVQHLDEKKSVDLEGDVVIPRDRIDFFQAIR